MATSIDNDHANLTQLTQSVTALAKSLEKAEQQNRRMQKVLIFAVLAMAVVVTSIFIPKETYFNEAHAANVINEIKQDVARAGELEQMLKQMLMKMQPALQDAGTLVARIKQDSDMARGSVLMRHYPGRYASISAIPESDLNSMAASEALMIGSIAEEIRFLNNTITQMNYNMALMTRDIDDAMGVMGDFMP